MILKETNSPLINALLQIICDGRGGLELTACAGTLIALCARANLTVADAKRSGSTRSREYFERVMLAYRDVNDAIAKTWTGSGNGTEIALVARVIEDSVAELSKALKGG